MPLCHISGLFWVVSKPVGPVAHLSYLALRTPTLPCPVSLTVAHASLGLEGQIPLGVVTITLANKIAHSLQKLSLLPCCTQYIFPKKPSHLSLLFGIKPSL